VFSARRFDPLQLPFVDMSLCRPLCFSRIDNQFTGLPDTTCMLTPFEVFVLDAIYQSLRRNQGRGEALKTGRIRFNLFMV